MRNQTPHVSIDLQYSVQNAIEGPSDWVTLIRGQILAVLDDDLELVGDLLAYLVRFQDAEDTGWSTEDVGDAYNQEIYDMCFALQHNGLLPRNDAPGAANALLLDRLHIESKYRNKGFGREAVKAFLSHFDRQADLIVVQAVPFEAKSAPAKELARKRLRRFYRQLNFSPLRKTQKLAYMLWKPQLLTPPRRAAPRFD